MDSNHIWAILGDDFLKWEHEYQEFRNHVKSSTRIFFRPSTFGGNLLWIHYYDNDHVQKRLVKYALLGYYNHSKTIDQKNLMIPNKI